MRIDVDALFSLAGRRAIVTGASSGLGRHLRVETSDVAMPTIHSTDIDQSPGQGRLRRHADEGPRC
jgi:hypothetical protein